jgi:hypothetical protein
MERSRYGRETAVKAWLDEHSRARWEQARYGRETTVKEWIQRSLTS